MIPTRLTTCGLQRAPFGCPPGRVSSRRCSCACAHDEYYKLKDCIWEGTEEDALAPGSLPEQLTPPWKVWSFHDWFTMHIAI